MRAIFIILIIFFLFAGCKRSERIPTHILPAVKMEAVLWDIIRADPFLNDFVLINDSSLDRKTESIKLYQKLFDIHSITREQFNQSLEFYREHPSLFKVVLDSLYTHSNQAATELMQHRVLKDSITPLKD